MAQPLLSKGQVRARALVCAPVPEFHYDLTPEIRAECFVDEDSGITSVAIQRDHSGAILALYISDNDYDYWQVSVTPAYAPAS